MQILNLTQHIATPAQVEQNVVEFGNKTRITDLLTFNEVPTKATIRQRAELLADIAMEHFQAVFDDGVFETDMFRALKCLQHIQQHSQQQQNSFIAKL